MRKLWLLALPAVPVLAVIGLYLYANSGGGRHFIEREIAEQSGGTVGVSGLGGSLPGRIRAAEIDLSDQDGVWLTIEDAALDWNPLALLRGKASIRTLSARHVTILRQPVPQADASSGKTKLPLRVTLDHLQLDRVDLAEPVVGAAASVTVTGSADLPSLWHSRADLAVKRLDGEGDYQLHALLEGNGSTVEIAAQEPAQGLLSRLADLPDLGPLKLRATLTGPPEAEKIQFNLTAGQLTGEGHGSADFKGRHLDLDLGVQSPSMTPRPDLSWKSAKLEAHVHGAFDQPEAEGRLVVEGVEASGSGLDRVEADLRGKDGKLAVSARLIGLQVTGVPPKLLGKDPVELTAEATLTGSAKSVAFTLSHPLLQAKGTTALTEDAPVSAEATVPDIAALAPLTGLDLHGRAMLKGQWDAKDRISLEGRLEQGRELLHLTAEGTAGQSFDLRWSAAASDVAKLGAPVQGALTAKGSLQGSAAHFTAAAEAQGRLAEAPLTLSLKLERSGEGALRLVIDKARWKSVEAGGKLDLAPKKDSASGTLQAKIGDLNDFSPFIGMPLTGSADAKLQMTQGKTPRAVIHADLRGVTWPSAAIGHLQADGSVEDPLAHPATSLRLVAEQLQAYGFSGRADLSAEGPESALKLSLSADLQGPRGPASLAADSLAVLPKNTLHLSSLRGTYAGETVKLLAPAAIAYGGPVTVSGLRLGDGPAELDIDGQAAPELALDARLKKTDLAALERFFPTFKTKGSLSAEARLEGEAARVDLRLDSGKNGAIAIAGTVPLQEEGALDLTARGALDLAILEPFLAADGREARGKVKLDATVSGPMAAPVIGGGAELQAVSLRDYAQGIRLSDIEGKLQADQGVLRLSGVSGKAGPGKFTLEGTIGVLQPGTPIDITFTAQNARPLARDLLTADMNADLNLGGSVANGLSLKGTVKVNRANINIPNSLPPTVATLKIKRKGAPPPPPQQAGLKMTLDVGLDAPEQIFVRGRGVDAEMGGKLQISGTIDDPQIAGGFDLRQGTFNLAGQTMNVTRGRISFDGSGPSGKLDPALDMTVESSSNGIDATLRVTGYADAPVLKLSSSPDLPQDEILARLLFNESVSQLSALQMASIAQGVAQMSGVGGGGFDPMASLRKHLGIDRLSVSSSGSGSEGNSNTMVEAGKYVATGVYVGTRQGLNGGTQARVQVDLTRHLKLDTIIGTGGGTPATGTTIDNDPGSSIGLTWQFDY